jgi:hypothetical protein
VGDILEINTWAAELQSNRMEDYADDLRRLKSNLNDLEGNLTFVNQIKGFKDDFQQMTQLIKQYFKFLKTTAKLYRNTQKEIVSAAKSLIN